MLRVKSPRDFGAGAMFILIGAAGLWFGRDYAVGTTARMGAGYMPAMLSWLLIAFGLVVGGKALAVAGPAIEGIQWRSVGMILLAILLFGLLIDRAGLVAAVVATTFVSALASSEGRWKEGVLLGLGLAAFCVVVFVYGLGQPLSVFGGD